MRQKRTKRYGLRARPTTTPEVVEQAVSFLSSAKPFEWTAQLGNVGRVVEEWRAVLVTDLGGSDEVSAMERIVVDTIVRTQVILEVLDQFIMNPRAQKIIDIKTGQAHFIVLQRKMYADSLVRYLQVLGLHKRRKPKNVASVIEELMRAASPADQATIEAVREEDEPRPEG